jgi:hypothetical protein
LPVNNNKVVRTFAQQSCGEGHLKTPGLQREEIRGDKSFRSAKARHADSA